MRIDFDSAWKDTTEVYFAALLELFEPQRLQRVGDHEPVSFLDQEMQELAQVLGDEGGAGVNVGGGGTVAAGSESQPYHGSRRGRRRAMRSGRPFNYPQVPDVKNPENFEKSIYNRFDLL